MIVLRATQKVLKLLPQSGRSPGTSDTALGDWYVNRIVVARQPLLLLVSASSLLPIIEPARDVKRLPERLAEIVATRLRRLGIDDVVIAAEIEAMSTVVVAKTADRSVTGQMVDFAKCLPYYCQRMDGVNGTCRRRKASWRKRRAARAGRSTR